MTEPMGLTAFQVAVAQQFFELSASQSYAVAGGAGLLARALIDRPTEDLDIFTHSPVERVTDARDAFLVAAGARGWIVAVLKDSPTFCRLHVSNRGNDVLVDLAVDAPPILAPTRTILGPTLTSPDLAARKLLALFGRAESRDFADIYLLAQQFGKGALLDLAAGLDAGFDPQVLAQMLATLDRFDDDEIPLPPEAVPAARLFFATWAAELHT